MTHPTFQSRAELEVYRVNGPAIIACSFGRSSSYMLCKIVEAHGGKLPDDVHVVNCNTGKEREEALEFGLRLEQYLGVYINRLEWAGNSQGFERVSHNSMARNGEPFAALIEKKGYLPNREAGYCSIELKTRVSWAFARNELGWKNWTSVVGFRHDEQGRVSGARVRNVLRKDCWRTAMPMDDAGIVKHDVHAFWRGMPFDLQLESYEDNCTLCWKKKPWKLDRIIRNNPGIEGWYVEQEERQLANQIGPQRFKLDETMRARADRVKRSPEFPIFDDGEDESCEGAMCAGSGELLDYGFGEAT